MRYNKEGVRDYLVLLAYDAASEWEFLEKMTALILDPDEWTAVQGELTEHTQLDAYKIAARSGSLTYVLCIVIQRWYPYKGYDSIRSPESLDHLKTAHDCVLCPYFKNVREYYGSSLGKAMCEAELRGGLLLFRTNLASTERLHGENLRRSLCRILITSEAASDMCAYFVGRQISADERPTLSIDERAAYQKTISEQRKAVRAAEKNAQHSDTPALAADDEAQHPLFGTGLPKTTTTTFYFYIFDPAIPNRCSFGLCLVRPGIIF